MEKAIIFENPGELDLNALRIMGVSVKQSDSPIGMFGTGLKYAVATAMRLGGSVEIVIDMVPHVITKNDVEIRGTTFAQVVLDGVPMGFTTDLGKKWEAWMVVRELLSNARDEGGRTFDHDADTYCPMPGGTSIILRGDVFLEVWAERNQYFLKESSPLQSSEHCDFYAHTCSGKPPVFYKGIRIHQADAPMMYTYNLKGHVDLTEDRTLSYSYQLRDRVCAAIVESDDEEMIERMIAPPLHSWEADLDFDIYQTPGETFRTTCKRLIQQKPSNLNDAAVKYYRKHTGDKPCLVTVTPTPVQEKAVARAVLFLRKMGYGSELDAMPIEYVEWLGEGVMGQAKLGRILLAKPIFDLGTKFIASTLLEEIVHNRTGFSDHTRELQTWLFDRIISMGEETQGEPL